MSWANCPLQGLTGQGSGSQYYFEASRDIRVWDTLPSGLSFVSSFRIIENHQWVYSTPTFLLGNAQWGCRINPSSSMRQWFEFWYNGSFVTDLAIDASLSSIEWSEISLICGVDESNQKATIFLLHRYPNQYNPDSIYYIGMYDGSQRFTNNNYCYQWIQGHIAPQYTWQSVPSISGKNGILSLVTLDSEAINDGEPVSGAAVSVFDQAPSTDNNVKDLADTYGSGEESSAVDVTVKYKVTLPPGGAFSVLKLVAKKDSIPEDATDGDKIVDISPSKTKKTVTGLDENSLYYFKIFAEDTNSNTSESDEKHITTSGDEGWLFDYTGSIQTFTAPKTGIYQLETWGAQGGDATDGTLTARGGYGAYAVGEVFLTQGDTIYINVGGQNGYGGGGNGEIQYDIDDLLISTDVTNYASGGSGNMASIKSLAAQYSGTNKVIYTYTKYSGSGDYSSPSMIYNNNKEFVYSRGDGVVAGYTGFPIRGISGMKSIEFDIVTTDTEDGSFVIALLDGNSHNVNLYSEEPFTTSGGLKHIVVDSGLNDYTYTYFAIGISRTLTISNVKITYAT